MYKILKIYDYEIVELKIPEKSTFTDINIYYKFWLENRLLEAGFNLDKIIEKYEEFDENSITFWQKGI